jgi:hypothetical protein
LTVCTETYGLSTSTNGAGTSTVQSQVSGQAPTVPPAQTQKRVEAKTERHFDPVGFAAKLQYSDEVKALGLTEDEAKAAYVGSYKGHVYIPGPRRGDGAPRGGSMPTGNC